MSQPFLNQSSLCQSDSNQPSLFNKKNTSFSIDKSFPLLCRSWALSSHVRGISSGLHLRNQAGHQSEVQQNLSANGNTPYCCRFMLLGPKSYCRKDTWVIYIVISKGNNSSFKGINAWMRWRAQFIFESDGQSLSIQQWLGIKIIFKSTEYERVDM